MSQKEVTADVIVELSFVVGVAASERRSPTLYRAITENDTSSKEFRLAVARNAQDFIERFAAEVVSEDRIDGIVILQQNIRNSDNTTVE